MVFNSKDSKVVNSLSEQCSQCKTKVILGESYCRKCGLPFHEQDRRPSGKLASFWRRFAAFFIDQTVVSVFIIPLSFVLSEWLWLSFILILLIHFSYNVVFNSISGQTPGKKLLKIRVITLDGSQLTLRKATIRWIGFQVSAFAFSIGFLWVIWDSRKQGWQDKLAGTCVVTTATGASGERTLLHPDFVRRQQRRWALILLVPLLLMGFVLGSGFFMFNYLGFLGSDEAEVVVTQFMEAGRDRDIDTVCELCYGVNRTELEDFIGGNRQLFDGFVSVRSTYWFISWNTGRSTIAEYEGVVFYESGNNRNLRASLVRRSSRWKITDIIIGW